MIEKFLAALLALVAAIEANTAALTKVVNATPGTAPAEEKKGKGKTTPADPAAGPTLAELRAAAQALLDANGNDGAALAELNKKYGTKRISEVPADKYAEVITAINAQIAKVKASADSGI